MRNSILLLVLVVLLFLTCPSKVQAQTWAKPGSTWTYSTQTYGWTLVKTFTVLRYLDTTTINNRLCDRLESVTITRFPNIPNGMVQYDGEYIYTHYSQQVLTYLSPANVFDTIAIFNAAPGAHWYERILPGNVGLKSPRRVTVRDTGHASINGV